ncbi:O-acetyl-ADP-ribose deacetylase MACROD2-like isoform X1 [Arapaima gigas]
MCLSVTLDGCIHKAAGPCLYDECHTLNGCETGRAKITCGYDLPAKRECEGFPAFHLFGPLVRACITVAGGVSVSLVPPERESGLRSVYEMVQNEYLYRKEVFCLGVTSGFGGPSRRPFLAQLNKQGAFGRVHNHTGRGDADITVLLCGERGSGSSYPVVSWSSAAQQSSSG